MTVVWILIVAQLGCLVMQCVSLTKGDHDRNDFWFRANTTIMGIVVVIVFVRLAALL